MRTSRQKEGVLFEVLDGDGEGHLWSKPVAETDPEAYGAAIARATTDQTAFANTVQGDVSPSVSRVDLEVGGVRFLGVAIQGAGGIRTGEKAELVRWVERRARDGDLAILVKHRADEDVMVTDISGPVVVHAYYAAEANPA